MNFLETLIQSVKKRSLNLLFQHTLFLCSLFFKNISTPRFRTNKLVNSVVYHLCPSILASGIHPYFFKLLRILSLSRMLVQFSLTCIFHHVWEKIFNLWCSHQKMNLIYAFLLMPQFSTQNSRYNFLKICFPQGPRTKGWRKL